MTAQETITMSPQPPRIPDRPSDAVEEAMKRWAICESKVAHETEQQARTAASRFNNGGGRSEARQIGRRSPKKVEPYRCPICSKWHTGRGQVRP